MKKKKTYSAANKTILYLIQQVMAVIMAVCITTVILGSMIRSNNEMHHFEFYLNPLEYDVPFEQSEVFTTVLESGIHDVVRMSVIKSQLETNGSFDENKEIDVTAYVKRAEQLSGSYVTAHYRLEDLLKWGKYGFEYTGTVFESEEDMNAFLADATTYMQYEGTYTTGFHPQEQEENAFTEDAYEMTESIYYPTETSPEMWDEMAEVTYISEETLERDDIAVAKEVQLYQTILNSRYKTTDGKTPQELVSTWEEYYELCDMIHEAANSLYYNYQEYLNYEQFYKKENTNLLYCMKMFVDGESVYYTNISLSEWNDVAISQYFNAFNNRIYYNPNDMDYVTTTHISEDFFLRLMNAYEYAYNENTKIWIAVDENSSIEDIFEKAEYSYNNFLPYWWEYAIGAVLCFLIYFGLLIWQSIYTGRKYVQEEGSEEGTVKVCVTKFEKLPTEIWFLLCAIVVGLVAIMAVFTVDMLAEIQTDNVVIIKIIAIETLITSVVCTFCFYSFVRRLKVHNLWHGSFLYHFIHWIWQNILSKVFGAIKHMYQNWPVTLRTFLPYVGFLVLNTIGIGLAVTWSAFFFFLLIALDVVVGWMLYKSSMERKKIVDGIGEIRNGDLNYQVSTEKLYGENRMLAEAVNSIGKGLKSAVETSMKDERLKADLITNVSHDIKTPLTSIINYVDLLKREDIQDEKLKNYIDVLDSKSQRLKQLTDDLVEASKISSGNIVLHFEKINIVELLNQAIGEFSEKFEDKNLSLVVSFEQKNMYIQADSRRMWRIMENLFNNIYKYALTGTRVYVDAKELTEGEQKYVVLSIKNISEQPLNINADELTERFIRGDVSRSTEGSGLGLSIARNLTEAQNGKFSIHLDGDLFKAVIRFKKEASEQEEKLL